MSYEKKTWATGDTITAADLNNMENGIAVPATMYVNFTSEDGEVFTVDKTYEEVYQAYTNGSTVVFVDNYDYNGGGVAVYYPEEEGFITKITYLDSDAQGLSYYLLEMAIYSDEVVYSPHFIVKPTA